MLKQDLFEELEKLGGIIRPVLDYLLNLKFSWFKGHSPQTTEKTSNEMIPGLSIITLFAIPMRVYVGDGCSSYRMGPVRLLCLICTVMCLFLNMLVFFREEVIRGDHVKVMEV